MLGKSHQNSLEFLPEVSFSVHCLKSPGFGEPSSDHLRTCMSVLGIQNGENLQDSSNELHCTLNEFSFPLVISCFPICVNYLMLSTSL